MKEKKEEAKRFNEGKIRYDLLDDYALEQMAKVMTHGLIDYGENNWKKGMPWSKVEASLKRHLASYKENEDFDPSSKIYHMAHVACNAMFLINYYRTHPEYDDRIKPYLNQPKIVLDIDEVVCGFAQGYEEYTGNKIGGEYWDSSYGTALALEDLKVNKAFWVNLPCIRKPNFIPEAYVSSRSINPEWTQEWLEKNGLPCRPVIHVPFGASKVEELKKLGTEIFIDDRFENFAEASRAGITSFLMNSSHNQIYDVGYRRIHDLQIRNIIR